MVDPRDICPNRAQHTPTPRGYVAWHEWAEKKMRRHYQVRCERCGRLSIWKPKPSEMADDEWPPE